MAKHANRQKRTIRVGVLSYDGCSAWVVAGILEAFEIANILAARGHANRKSLRFLVRLISPWRRSVSATGGIKFTTVVPSTALDILVIPPIWHRSKTDLSLALMRLAPLVLRLPALARRSRLVASACSGAILLAEAGLLNGKTITTCWWLSDWFRKSYPAVHVAPERLLAADGRTWTAGAGSAYVHLCLRIIDSFAGKDLSAMTARFLLVEPNRETQSPYFSPEIVKSDSDTMSTLEGFVVKHIDRLISVSELASTANMSLRSLFRFFQQEKGVTPLKFMQRIRIEHAKRLLEVTRLSVDWIAPKCGYEDVSSFRKLFRKRVGMTPKEYSKLFGTA